MKRTRAFRPIAGGTDHAAHIAELTGRGLDNLTPEELQELDTAIQARAEELQNASTVEEVAELEGLADTAEQVRAENERRAAESPEAIAERRAAAAERLQPPAPAEAETPAAEAEVPAEAPAETPAPVAEAEGETPEQLAASNRPVPGAAAAHVPAGAEAAPAEVEQGDPATIIAAGDLSHFSAGSELTFEDFGRAFADKAQAIKGTTHKGRALVASIRWEYPEDRRLGSDPQENSAIIASVVEQARQTPIEAIVAAGGLCAPVGIRYDIPTVASARRPLRDSALVRFGAQRGGVRFMRPPVLTDLDDAIGLWTEANDEAAAAADFDPDNPGDGFIGEKPCIRIACAEQVEVVVDAITRCLIVGNFNRRSFPEQFSAWWSLAEAAHARFAENRLFARMAANSTAVTDDQQLGAAPDIFEAVERLTAQYRSRHRMDENAVLRYVAPDWVRNFIVADVLRAQNLDPDRAFRIGAAQVNEWFAQHSVAVTWTPDGDGQHFTAQATGATKPWPASFDALLYHEGAHIFIDDGELDLGTEIRDTSLIRTNDVEAFTETFENTAFVGLESLVITHNVCASGIRQAAAAVDVCGGGTSGGS